MNPTVDSDVINPDPAFDEKLFDVSVGQSVAEVPTDSEHDHLGREPEARERATIDIRRLIPMMAHLDTVAGQRPDPSTQQCRAGWH